MSAYLAAQTTHLQNLHTQLGLPSTELQSDEAKIEVILKTAISSLVSDRERQVEVWKDDIQRLEGVIDVGRRAVGRRGREIGWICNRTEGESLPNRYKRLMEVKEDLVKVYQERLDVIHEHQATLQQLASLLGAIELPPQLIPLPNQAPSTPVPDVTESSTTSADPGSSTIREKSTTKCATEDIPAGGVWLNVSEDVTDALLQAIQAANDERVNRLKSLINLFRNLTWLHHELILPPLPPASNQPSSSSSSSTIPTFPQHLLPSPSTSTTETSPSNTTSYLEILRNFMICNPDAAQPAPDLDGGEEGEEGEEIDLEDVKGMEGIEPEINLMQWAEEIDELWSNEKTNREARIQNLFDQIEPLWTRMGEEQDYIDLFIDSNRGSGEATIEAYEIELERVLEIRRSSLSQFVISARAEIETLSNELMLSDEEKAEFGAFIDDDYTETLLLAHENEVTRLRNEINLKAPLLPKVREWQTLVQDEIELEIMEKDPNRFSRRGGGMLKEEKLRKRVTVLKPRIEADLIRLLPAWEEETGRSFSVNGMRVIDQIFDAIEAKEAAKDAKKRAKSGLAPTPLPKSHQTPSISQRATSTSTRTRQPSQAPPSARYPSSVGPRKREAPTPTPFGNGAAQSQIKRQKIGSTVGGRVVSGSTVRGGNGLGGGVKGNTLNQSTGSHPSPTPLRFTGQPSVSSISNSNSNSTSMIGGGRSKLPTTIPGAFGYTSSITKPTIGGIKKSRRESFKPRQSVGLGFGLPSAVAGGYIVGEGWEGVMEEDEDVF